MRGYIYFYLLRKRGEEGEGSEDRAKEGNDFSRARERFPQTRADHLLCEDFLLSFFFAFRVFLVSRLTQGDV